MRVLITGGTGLIGKATCERLVERGWEVLSFDLKTAPDNEIAGVEYVQGDILNYDDLLPAMQGCDAVIHLAALRGPTLAPSHIIYQVNVQGTFNVYEAAAATGIKRVVQASSINAFGCFYGVGDLEVDYLPIDEDHPTNTTDSYSFSKQTIESIGDYYWRRDGISGVALRYPGVYERSFAQSERFLERRTSHHDLISELASLAQSELEARIDVARELTADFRRLRPFDYPNDGHRTPPPAASDPVFRLYAFDRFNFFAFVDERDAALSLELGVTARYDGAHPLFINDSVNYLGYDAPTLARVFYPTVHDLRGLSGASALVSIDKARALIGFEPEHSLAALGLA